MRIYPRDDEQAAFIGPWIAQKYKDKKIAILHDKSAYGKGLAEVVKKKLNEAGVTEVLFEGINPGEKDYTAVVTKLKNAGAEFVYFGGYHPEGGLMLRQAADQGYKLNLMMGDSIATSEFWQISGPRARARCLPSPPIPAVRQTRPRRLSSSRLKGSTQKGSRCSATASFRRSPRASSAQAPTIPRPSPRRSRTASRSRPSLGPSGSTARAISSTRATTSINGPPANTRQSSSSEPIEPHRLSGVGRGPEARAASRRLVDERFDQRVERLGRLPLRRMARARNCLNRAPP